jgi:putative membrane protein insertion efficiency factor
MGHRDSSEEFGGQGDLCGDHRRSVAPAEEAVSDTGKSANHSAGVRAALFALNIYKSYLSPLLAGNCRYQPTCSRYTYEAIERFGVARGVWLGTKRLLRCHPLSRKFGYDPVPEKWEEMRSNSAMPSDTHGVRS